MNESAREKAVLRRDTRFLPDGSYAFRDRLQGKGGLTAEVLTGRAWLLEWFELKSGTVCCLSGERKVWPKTPRFWIFYPPFSLTRVSLDGAQGRVIGRAGLDPVPPQFAAVPFLFESAARIYEERMERILANATNAQSIDAYPNASSLSQKVRRFIAKLYTDELCIADIAHRLGVSHSHLTRQFRRDYGMTPRDYVHRLRIADVPFRLARGESIANASWDAGYRDLTRFYRQFRKATRSSPAVCRQMVAPRDR